MTAMMSLYLVLLFVAFTPGVLVVLPKGGSRLTVAVVHGVLFAAVWHLTHKMVWKATSSMSGFEGGNGKKPAKMA